MAGSPLGDFLGWWLALLLPALAVVGPLRRNGTAAQAYLLAVFLHVAAAVIYVYVPGILPARADAHSFHNFASSWQAWGEWPSLGVGSQLIKVYLAYVYSLVGASFFLGSVLSIYAFAFSVLVLVKFMELLGVQRGTGLVVLLFGALPTAVLYGSVPLREAYQVLFFMLACYWGLRFRLSSQPLHLIAAVVFGLAMGLLHKGLILYAPFFLTIMLLVRMDQAAGRLGSATLSPYLHRFAAVALAIGFVAALPFAVQELEGVQGSEFLRSAAEGNLIDHAAEYRSDDGNDRDGVARTDYGIDLDTSSPFHLVYTSLLVLFYYMFTPFPWRIQNLMDIYAFGEVVMRVFTLAAIFRMWRKNGPVHPQIVTLLMLVYLSMAFVWAAGTTNYGTATRHHMIHQWILLLLGVPVLIRTNLFSVRRARADERNYPVRLRAGLSETSTAVRALGKASLRPRRLGAEHYHARRPLTAKLVPGQARGIEQEKQARGIEQGKQGGHQEFAAAVLRRLSPRRSSTAATPVTAQQHARRT